MLCCGQGAGESEAAQAAQYQLAVARAGLVLSDPPASHVEFESGFDAAYSEEYPDAVSSLHAMIDAAPTDPAALSLLAAVLFRSAGGTGAAEAVRVLRHARRHNPDNLALARNYADGLDALDRAWRPQGAAAAVCSYAVPWGMDSRQHVPTARDEWKPLVYAYDGGNMLSTWVKLASEEGTARCAASATWVGDVSCIGAADAVVFDCPDGTEEDHASTALLRSGGKAAEQLWVSRHDPSRCTMNVSVHGCWGQVLFCAEGAGRYPLLSDAAFLQRFDIRYTHQPDADLTFSYLPRRAEIFRTPAPPKTRFANWVASNCVEHRVRKVQELMSALCPLSAEKDDCRQVDCLGACLRNAAWPEEGEIAPVLGSTKLAVIGRYKFTLAYENSQAEGYVTEKFFHPLIAGSVPVYWGAPDVGGFAPHPSSYVNAEDFGSAAELAAHLAYLDRNDTAYNEMLAWKDEPLGDRFLAKAADSDVLGDAYGEGVQHKNPMGGWDPCRLNTLIRARIDEARQSENREACDATGEDHSQSCGAALRDSPVSTGVVAAGALNKLDGRIAGDVDVWWLSISAPESATHMLRLTELSNPDKVVQHYCSVYPCGQANEVALRGAISESLDQAALRAKLERMGNGVKRCVLGSRNEGFFSNVLQAVDGLMLCAAAGLPATVQWTEADFPYRSLAPGRGDSNAWDQFFRPVGSPVPKAAIESGETVVISGYSRMPRQVPTQFERYANA